MLTMAICDDNKADVELLEDALDKIHNYLIDYDVYYSAEELLKNIVQNKKDYQLYIFDIEMPGMTGLQLAEKVRKINSRALFVFLTGYTQYVMEVFSVVMFDYISKPITTEKLNSVLSRVVEYLKIVKQDFVFHYCKDQFSVSCDDILYIEKKGRLAVIHTISENFKTNMTINEIWEQLDDRVFTHIHVSFIINMDHLRSIEGAEAVLDNGEHLLTARAHKQELKEKHMEFIRRKV